MATLLLRTVEGRVLTSLEVDNNFSNLNIEIADVGNNLANAEGNVGIVTNLTTTATDNIVEAINEIEANVNALGSMSLQSNANVNITNTSGFGLIDLRLGNDPVDNRISAVSMVANDLFVRDFEGFVGANDSAAIIRGLDSTGNLAYLYDGNVATQEKSISTYGNVKIREGSSIELFGPVIHDIDFPTLGANGNVNISLINFPNEIYQSDPSSNIFLNIDTGNLLNGGKILYINYFVENFGSNIYYPKGLTLGNLKSDIIGTEQNMNISWEGSVVPSVPPGSDMLYSFRIRTFTNGFVVYGSSRVMDNF